MHSFLNDIRVIKILDEFAINSTEKNIKQFNKIEERFSFTKRKATVNFSLNLLKLKNERETSNDVKQILRDETLKPELKRNEDIFKEQMQEQHLAFCEKLKKKKMEKQKNSKKKLNLKTLNTPEALINDYLFHFKNTYISLVIDKTLNFYKKILYETIDNNIEIFKEYNDQIKDFEFMSIDEDSKLILNITIFTL
jgi:hypothetical protein